MNGKDPYKYFRIEARELSEALNQGILELEKGAASKELIAKLLRSAHTLKGAARVVKLPAIADLAHAVEEALSPFREGAAKAPQTVIDSILKLLDSLSDNLSGLEEPAAKPSHQEATASVQPPRFDTVRLEVGEVDAVLERMSEAAVHLAHLRQEMTGFDRMRRLSHQLAEPAEGDTIRKRQSAVEELDAWMVRFQRLAGASLDQAERDLRQAHERAERLRLLPAAALFGFLERAVRDAAQVLGKKVRFEADGGDCRLDAPVLSSLQEALLHVVRNAVAHGLESPAARAASGKSAAGCVRVEVKRQGGRVSFICRDDGQGIDVASVRRAAVAKGLLPPSTPDPMGLEAAVQILLRGGISTAAAVTAVSGRGIGLDVVRETVERLQGEVRVESRSGLGMAVEIQVPYSLSTFPALAVEADGVPLLIPFDGVRRALRVTEQDVARSPEGDTVLFGGGAVPFMALDGVLSRNPGRIRRACPAVVVESAAGVTVVGVDRILGVRETVARPMPALAPSEEIVSGATLDAEGNPCLVLDPDGLIRAARMRKGGRSAPEATAKPVILIVDDSLTTRMLEQSILESAGYEVDTAVSGEEALGKARQKRYGLFLVDVEMPGIDGFQLLEKFREDGGLRDIPAILVTSRVSREDRKRAESVGARDHIAKGEFDQTRLLARIREFIG